MTKSRWANWSSGSEQDKLGFDSFLKEAGNPMTSPAERAAQLGYQSDGSGGYIDPKTGQIAARTINGELVFYNQNGAGGVVSDSEGGEQLATAQPSWSDPKTGMLTTPPAQPESPEELAAVPDATPAVAPHGYSDFMKKKKELAYSEPEEQENPGEMSGAMADMMGDGDMGVGDAGGMMGEDYAPADLAQRANPGAPPRGYRKGHPQFKDYDAKLTSFQQSQAQVKNPPVQQQTEPNPQKPGQPSLNDVISGIQKEPEAKPEEPKPQTMSNFQQAAKPQPARDEAEQEEFDMDNLRSKALGSFQDWSTARISADDRMKKHFEPMLEALNQPGVNPELRNRILNTHLNAYQYQGRDNEASSDLNGGEFQALMDNRDRIMAGYGGKGSDGSAHNFDAIRQFQKEINDIDLDDETIKKSFNALSPAQQKIFKGGDMSALQGYKKYLSQHFKGGYTGLPLDMNTMQMEHFIDNSQSVALKNLAKQEGRDLTPEEQELVDFIASEDNQFWSRQGPNEQKSSRNIAQFYGDRIDPLKDLGADFFDFREMKVNPARLNLKNQEKEFVGGLVSQDDDDDFRYLSEMDMDQYNAHKDAVNQIYGNEKEQLLSALSEAFDKKGLMGLTPKKLEKAISDPNSDITEDDQTMFDMLSNLKGKVKGYNPDFAYRLTQSLGLPSNFIQSERARSTPVSPAIYDGIVGQLAGKNKEEQREFLTKVKDVFGKAQTAANQGRGKGNKDEDIRRLLMTSMMSGMRDQGIFSDEMLSDTKGGTLGSLAKKYLSQMEEAEMPMMDMVIGDDPDPSSMQEIIEVIRQLLEMKKPQGRMNFEEFKRLKGWIL